MTVDEETMKQIGSSTATATAVGLLGWVGLWFLKITGVPKRVDRLEKGRETSDRLLLALADSSLARAPKDKVEARESLREAREAMYTTLTKAQGGKL
jgi:hypothetical protein